MSIWPDHLSKVLVDLRFISNIKENEKPCFNKRIYVDSDSWYGSIYRMVYNESGRDTHQRIRIIIHDAMNQFNSLTTQEYKKVIYKHVKQAYNGLRNLVVTYDRHPEVMDNLEVLSTEINNWLKLHEANYAEGDNGLEEKFDSISAEGVGDSHS